MKTSTILLLALVLFGAAACSAGPVPTADAGPEGSDAPANCEAFRQVIMHREVCVSACTPEREYVTACLGNGSRPALGCYVELATGNLYSAPSQFRVPPGFRECDYGEEYHQVYPPKP
jgi:hypothetical protein